MRAEFDDDVADAVAEFARGVETSIEARVESKMREIAGQRSDSAQPPDIAAHPLNQHIDRQIAATDPRAAALYGADWASASAEQRAARAQLERNAIELADRAKAAGRTDTEADIIAATARMMLHSTPARAARAEVINRQAAQRQGIRTPAPGGAGMRVDIGGGGGGASQAQRSPAEAGAAAIAQAFAGIR